MKSHLTTVSLALLSAAFLLGCQEQGSELVGPESLGPVSLGPGFANAKKTKKDCPAHPSCKTSSEDGQTVTVTLAGGMTGTLKLVKVFSDNGKKFAMNTTAQSSGTITMNFPAFDGRCSVENFTTGTPEDDEVLATLKDQLNLEDDESIDVSTALFEVRVDRRNNENNVLDVTYDPDGSGQVILGWARRDPISVTTDQDKNEVFTFTGGRIRVGEVEGRARDRIRILCPSDEVTVTVTVIREGD